MKLALTVFAVALALAPPARSRRPTSAGGSSRSPSTLRSCGRRCNEGHKPGTRVKHLQEGSKISAVSLRRRHGLTSLASGGVALRPRGEPERRPRSAFRGTLTVTRRRRGPPRSSARAARPRPLPPVLVEKNGSKMRSARSGSMPGPESWTYELDASAGVRGPQADLDVPVLADGLQRVLEQVDDRALEQPPVAQDRG